MVGAEGKDVAHIGLTLVRRRRGVVGGGVVQVDVMTQIWAPVTSSTSANPLAAILGLRSLTVIFASTGAAIAGMDTTSAGAFVTGARTLKFTAISAAASDVTFSTVIRKSSREEPAVKRAAAITCW